MTNYCLEGVDKSFDFDESSNDSFITTVRLRWDYSFIAVGLHGSRQTLELTGIGDSAWLSGSYNAAYLFEYQQHAHISGKKNHVSSWNRAGATSIWLDGIDGTADLYGEKASVQTSAVGISNAVGLHGKNETAYLYGQNDSAWINGQSCTTYLYGKNQSAHISSNTNSVKVVGKANYSISFDGWADIVAGSEESTIDVGALSHGTIKTVAGVATNILGNADGHVQVLIDAIASFSPPSPATVVASSPPSPTSVLLVTRH